LKGNHQTQNSVILTTGGLSTKCDIIVSVDMSGPKRLLKSEAEEVVVILQDDEMEYQETSL